MCPPIFVSNCEVISKFAFQNVQKQSGTRQLFKQFDSLLSKGRCLRPSRVLFVFLGDGFETVGLGCAVSDTITKVNGEWPFKSVLIRQGQERWNPFHSPSFSTSLSLSPPSLPFSLTLLCVCVHTLLCKYFKDVSKLAFCLMLNGPVNMSVAIHCPLCVARAPSYSKAITLQVHFV